MSDRQTDRQMEAPMQSNHLTLEDKSPNNDDNDGKKKEDIVSKGSAAGDRRPAGRRSRFNAGRLSHT